MPLGRGAENRMLLSLSIRDVVLIERLDLEFGSGLGVLTGETGAGKSILLDSLGLALGSRAEARLVRHGAKQASVSATFDIPAKGPVRRILDEHGFSAEDEHLIVRRILGADGRSRAFVNDQPASVALLKTLGEALIEVHGQFESQRLLSPANHIGLLDAYGGLNGKTAAVAEAWRAWRAAREALNEAERNMAKARQDEDYLRHALSEIEALEPRPGEEQELAERRSQLMHGEKLKEAMNLALARLGEGRGVEDALGGALRTLQGVAVKAGGRLDAATQGLERAAIEAAEGVALLEKAQADLELDEGQGESIEERLFALRALARKHATEVDALPALMDDLRSRIAGIEDGGAHLAALARAEAEAGTVYGAVADGLSMARGKAAAGLDAAVGGELAPLKLEKATFRTAVRPLAEGAWGERGKDAVAFEVSTNPGTPPGPLGKIASGGELSRFMLALKAVLAKADDVPTIIFDEVDSGIGGAVAAAVGERLVLLAQNAQVLVVTHSPQVASLASHHWRVSKGGGEAKVTTNVDSLAPADRKEEIARMLAGATITDEARAAAKSLIEGARP